MKHYRSTISKVEEHFDSVFIDIDYAENLTVPLKCEPQSLHCSHEQVTVHSGILKYEGEKSYYPYLSEDKKHDQHFVYVVLYEMLKEIENTTKYIITESNNCKSQYKSAAHFVSIQSIADFYDKKVLQIFRIAEPGKGEVDHVGGIAKTTIRCEIANGVFSSGAEEMVDFL